MGWLNWLLGAALAVGAALLVAETVSYLITKQSLRNFIINQRNTRRELSNAVAAMVKNIDGHSVSMDFLDSFDRNLGSGKVTSSTGVSSEIRSGDVIKIN